MNTEITEITGSIDKIIYKNNDTGFSVISLKINSQESVIIKGTFPEAFQGEVLHLKGTWDFHPKFGRQLTVSDYSTKTPTSAHGIERYLASGLIKGIGPKFAAKLVREFGEQTLEVIEHHPEKLFHIPGVGEKRVALIRQAWLEQKEISKVMIFLREKDVSTSFAVKIYKTYGNQAINIIQQNPYRLIDDIWGIGFKSADQIALKLGLACNAIARIKAGILHAINEATSNGHLYAELEEAKTLTVSLLNLEGQDHAPLLKQALQELYVQEKIKLISHDANHFITVPQFYYAEKNIAKKINTLIAHPSIIHHVDLQEIYHLIRLPDNKGMELNEDQQRGILACFQNKVHIITGGPGTGKTTLIKKLLEVLEHYHLKFRLAAPTGRAAKRMFEGTGRNTETLHRLLEFTPGVLGFARNEQNALSLDFLIVDESSMVDVFLMNALLKALPEKAHLILLGDIDQLPSVGAGNVLNDLIHSNVISVTRLTQIFRQAQDSLIIVNAHRVNKGEFPLLSNPQAKNDFFYLKQDVPEDLFSMLRTLYTKKLPAFGINPQDSVVLAPMNRGVAGTQRINQELQLILNPTAPEDKQISRFGTIYKINDRVMQIRNNYDKFIFNGDIGYISDIDKENQKLYVNFGERPIEYDFAELNELTLAYAISIHKSQGSEFGAVIVPLFMQHFVLLQRNLIYTAITRAKKYCFLVGQSKALAMAIKNNKSVIRYTFLKEFLTSSLQAR